MIKEMASRLRGKGVTPTIQRVAILEYLKKQANHPTAEEIYEEVRVNFPSLSRATVYNTLELLSKLGEIQQLMITKDKARYDPNPNPHHHFFCRRCEKLLDIDVSCPIAESGWVDGNKIGAVQACFYGICSECLEKEAQKDERA